jgi:type II secretory pathway predicted ATPase ExeA
MYLHHWGIDRSPFQVGPNRTSFYRSVAHEEALARIDFLSSHRRRLGLLLGESGIGKSLILQVAARSLKRAGKVVVLFDPVGASRTRLYWQVANQLGISSAAEDDLTQLWSRIADRIHENRTQQLDTVLLVDDADSATPDLMTELLRLPQLDPQIDARWTTVLAASPAGTRQWTESLCQQIDLRIDLERWDEPETVGFIQIALVEAGRVTPVFDEEAVSTLHNLAKGLPRHVVRLADFAMLAGAAAKLERIDAETVRRAHREVIQTTMVAV